LSGDGHENLRAASRDVVDVVDVDAAVQARDRRQLLGQWLRPGIGIKRWLFAALVGQILIALAAALVLRPFLAQRPDSERTGLVDLLSLQFLSPEWRATALFAVGVALFVYGGWRVLRALVEPYRLREEPIAEVLYQRRLRARGPRVVAIGGGTGLSVLLRGLKQVTSNITAVVTVADDGGSSGKLRTELGLPPMGDIRMCIAALADAEPAMSSLLQYRFPAAEGDDSSFPGHAFGNLLIAALTDVNGDFEEGVRQSNRVLAVRGSVVPVAGQPITLHAELADGTQLEGESQIERSQGIKRIWITPEDVKPSAEALTAIGTADVVVIGPGSLYTSLLPPLLVPGMREALSETRAARVFVCNVATQLGETEGYKVSDHLTALATHGLGGLIDAVLVNTNTHARQLVDDPAAPVAVDVEPRRSRPPLIVSRDVVDDANAHRHDARKLTAALLELYDERIVRRAAPVVSR
jgi:uncharacterized cofD-like protein